jgi:hypothetical protein
MKRITDNWIKSYLEYTDNTEPPELYREWVAVSTVAAVMQRKCFLRWGDLTFYPNMYIVLVGPSGKCRKGTAMNPAAKMLRDLGVPMAAEAITREALIRELKKANNTDINPKTGEVTLHSSLTIFSQELTVFLGYNNVALMSDLTDWYDCRDKWTYRTKNMGVDEIINVWVNLIGATTPELVQTTLPRDAIGGGLTSRIIFVYEEDKGKLVPDPFLTEKELKLREDLLIDLERIGTLRGEFRVTPQFLDRYIDWYIQQHSNPPFEDARFSGYIERRPNHLFKLCIIHSAAMSESLIINEDIFNMSLSLMERTEKKMPLTFAGVGKSANADVLSRVMAYIGLNGRVSYERLMNAFYYDADRDTMDKILATLIAMKFCRQVTAENGVFIEHLKRDTNKQ